MNINVRLAAAAATLLIAIAGAAVWIGTGRPQPSPSPAPTAAASPTPLNGALQHRWNGPTRPVTGMTPAAATAAVTLTPNRMTFDGGGAPRPDLASRAGLVGTNEIEFELLSDQAGCDRGTIGRYGYALSAGGGYLTLTLESDACAARADAVVGDWDRSTCPNPNAWCLGALEAGTHVSAVFNPFVEFDSWTFRYGRLEYTVPDGWSNDEEDRAQYVISQTAVGEDASIWLLSDETAHAQGDSCPENVTDGTVGRTPAALAAWVRSLPGIAASTPAPVTIGGLSGVSLDVSLKPTFTRTCPGGTEASVQLFADTDGREHDVAVHGNVPMRIFLLDVGDGRSMVIFINGTATTYEALLPEATAIIESFQFHR